MNEAQTLRAALESCPKGIEGWAQFEELGTAILKYLLVPPLEAPTIQARSYSGIDRRDAAFPNRNFEPNNHWGKLYKELGVRLLLVEFKNYEAEVGKDEINQTRNYLTKPMGRLAIICSRTLPNEAAHIKRNSIFHEDGKVILFVTEQHLIEMLSIKERGEDPSDLIMDLVEQFYLQYE